MYKILHLNYEERITILFPGKQRKRMNNKDLFHTENSNKKLIECYIEENVRENIEEKIVN